MLGLNGLWQLGRFLGSDKEGNDVRVASGTGNLGRSETGSSLSYTKQLEAKLGKTLLICESMWELLRDEHGWTDEKLREKILEVDMRDGVLDGQNKRKAVKCPSCGHTVSSRHAACLYCGHLINNSIFDVE